ncbi:hypothetical protein HPB47_028356 [Ixodes persulcatus]|uniref:Uncharacterized protein n=1 Tax=Ixodes persulcatus TaxID=34615 RepID=A0AC60PTM9_IXOPE|nr:hypothetical protein HPB47_028356 [Ixodes persulcatus]
MFVGVLLVSRFGVFSFLAQEGNELYKENRPRQALGKYHRCLLYIKAVEEGKRLPIMPEPREVLPIQLKDEVMRMRADCYNNLAVTGDDKKAACKCEIRAHYADLVQHMATEKHVRNSRPLSSARLTTMGFTKSSPPRTIPELELKLACYSACHATIRSVDSGMAP